MKKISSPSNILTALFLLAFAIAQYPSIKKNFDTEGNRVLQKQYFDLKNGSQILFPPDGNSIAIFWASWCVPCKLEMERLKKSVVSGNIPKNRIFAFNVFENSQEIKKFLDENNYPFQFPEAGKLGNDLKIDRTPTTLFIEEGKITSMSSGLSLIGIWKAENLF